MTENRRTQEEERRHQDDKMVVGMGFSAFCIVWWYVPKILLTVNFSPREYHILSIVNFSAGKNLSLVVDCLCSLLLQED